MVFTHLRSLLKMLKHRVLPLVLLNGYNVVKSVQFRTYRTLGNPITICRIYEGRGVDELVLLDIRATVEKRGPNLDIIRDISGECFMPLTIGGGIVNLEQVRQILRAGADKVAVNSSAIENPQLVADIAREFGSQCCVVSIDAKQTGRHSYEVYTHGGKQLASKTPADWAREAESLGAGEILLNSIDRDGVMQGYDIELMRSVTAAVSIPVIAAGGAGKPEHFSQVFKEAHVSAVAAASIYHFSSITPMEVKHELDISGIAVRL
jgi:imidazole glycerol-phosphate synthase subunit HisF